MKNREFADWIDKIKDQADIREIIGQRIELNNSNMAICPFHDDQKASLKFYPDTGTFYCFGCGAHGDVIEYLMRIEKKDFWDITSRLSRQLGISIPEINKESIREIEEERSIEDILEESAKYYHANLTQEVKDYLIQDRGLSQETISRFQIGYANGKLKEHLLDKCKFSVELCIKSGVLIKVDGGGVRDYFYNRITLPNFKNGRVVHISSRSLNGQEPKYLHLPGEMHYIFNEDALSDEVVYVVEGFLDCLSLVQAGYPTVATIGTHLKTEYLNKFDHCKFIYICFDGDEAGINGALKLGEIFGERARIVELPKDCDPNTYFQDHSKEDFDILIENAKDIIRYELNLIPPDTDRIMLPDILKSILNKLAKLEKAKVEAYLVHIIKPYFDLSGKEIDGYRDLLNKLRKKLIADNADEKVHRRSPIDTIYESQPALHPAMNYTGDNLWYVVKGAEGPVVVGNRQAIYLDEFLNGRGAIDHLYEGSTRFSPNAIGRYIDGAEVDAKLLINSIITYLDNYIIFKESWQPILIAVWIVGTYLHRMFTIFPYIWLHSPAKRCSKTRVLELIYIFSFNPTLTGSPTEATLFREAAITGGTLCLDENENIGNKEKSNLLSILNVAYRKHTKVPRCEGEDFRVVNYEPFRPIAHASISAPPDTIKDRSLKIEMERKRRDQKVGRLQIDRLSSEVQPLVDELHILALTKAPDILEALDNFDHNVIPEECDDRLRDGMEIMFSIAAGIECIELIPHLQEAVRCLSKVRSTEELDQNDLLIFADILIKYLEEDSQEKWGFKTSELVQLCKESGYEWPPEKIRGLCRRLGFRSGTPHRPGVGTIRGYEIKYLILKEFMERYGGTVPDSSVPPNDSSDNNVGSVGNLKDQVVEPISPPVGEAKSNASKNESNPLILLKSNGPNG